MSWDRNNFNRRLSSESRGKPSHPFGRPYRASYVRGYPGLKPRAILYRHFMALTAPGAMQHNDAPALGASLPIVLSRRVRQWFNFPAPAGRAEEHDRGLNESEFRSLRQAKRLRTFGGMRVVSGLRPPLATRSAKEDRAPGTIGSIVPI